MTRLRQSKPTSPGWSRTRRGTAFSYRDAAGAALPDADVERIKALAIPPAWTDVWISPHANGHIQALGTDAAGRRQYLYHKEWRTKRDALKFDRVTQAAAGLPKARRRIAGDLTSSGMALDRACATAVRLLDVGYFRIGSDAYTDANGSFGLTTLERSHVRKHGEALVFAFVGKSSIAHRIVVDDTEAVAALDTMRTRRGGSDRLLAYRGDEGWHDLAAADVNRYLGEVFGGGLTAKDFRTWHATVIAAASLGASDEGGETQASRRRAVKSAVNEVAAYLGNTPTIAKGSYIDPRVLDLYESGVTVGPIGNRTYGSAATRQAALEKAVLALLAE